LIHGLTGGIPRRINTPCNRLFLASFLAEKHGLNTVDVQAIAQEIDEELGPESTLSAVSVVADPNDATTELALPSRSETKMWRMHFEKLEERIDRLERTVGAAVELLHKLLHPEKATTKPGKPVGR